VNASELVRKGVPIWRMELCGAGDTVRVNSRNSWGVAVGMRTALIEEVIRNLLAFFEVMGYLLSLLKSTRFRPRSTRKQAAIIMKSGTRCRFKQAICPQYEIMGALVAPRLRSPRAICGATGARTEGIRQLRIFSGQNAMTTGSRGLTRAVTRHEQGSVCRQTPALVEGERSTQHMGEW